ncbi:MAG: DNA/RNA non-specific endonuclease [Leptolyngbyaceae cyanobacterium CSU_1_4]|nr:DNA/RNA non-specific endonuclease [Leptolyngbyaceae cyanobacterium CSU_1_4]
MQLFFNFPRSSWQSQCLRPLLIGVAALFMLSSCSVLPKDPRISQSADNPNALLGLPSSATSFNANDYLISRPQYVLSYNRSKAIPNWASWQLNQTWLGSRPRIPFEPDQTLPSSWEKVSPNDYTGSGFDRGHVVPAADRNKTADDSRAVFLMTNIFPQAPDNNQGPWAQLESYCRDLVAQGKELYIVAGGAGEGGTGEKGTKGTIAQGQVSVPAFTWKVVVVSDRPGSGQAGITKQTRVIAVILPNKQGINSVNWREYRTSVNQVEELTGYDLLSNIPELIQEAIEAKTDAMPVQPPLKIPTKAPIKTPVKQPVGKPN